MPGRAAVHIVTLGCPKNEVDSDRMAARLSAAGHELTTEPDTARVAVVNTCAFIREATEQSIETVLELAADWKAQEPGRLLVVAGCMPSRYAGDLAAEMPEVDAFVPVADEDSIAQVVRGLLTRDAAVRLAPGGSDVAFAGRSTGGRPAETRKEEPPGDPPAGRRPVPRHTSWSRMAASADARSARSRRSAARIAAAGVRHPRGGAPAGGRRLPRTRAHRPGHQRLGP